MTTIPPEPDAMSALPVRALPPTPPDSHAALLSLVARTTSDLTTLLSPPCTLGSAIEAKYEHLFSSTSSAVTSEFNEAYASLNHSDPSDPPSDPSDPLAAPAPTIHSTLLASLTALLASLNSYSALPHTLAARKSPYSALSATFESVSSQIGALPPSASAPYAAILTNLRAELAHRSSLLTTTAKTLLSRIILATPTHIAPGLTAAELSDVLSVVGDTAVGEVLYSCVAPMFEEVMKCPRRKVVVQEGRLTLNTEAASDADATLAKAFVSLSAIFQYLSVDVLHDNTTVAETLRSSVTATVNAIILSVESEVVQMECGGSSAVSINGEYVGLMRRLFTLGYVGPDALERCSKGDLWRHCKECGGVRKVRKEIEEGTIVKDGPDDSVGVYSWAKVLREIVSDKQTPDDIMRRLVVYAVSTLPPPSTVVEAVVQVSAGVVKRACCSHGVRGSP